MFNKEKKEICPFIAGQCIESRCKFWVHLRGKDPQSTQEVDEYSCAITWIPILLIENSQFVRQTAAAVDDLKNQTIQRQDLFNHTINSALLLKDKR